MRTILFGFTWVSVSERRSTSPNKRRDLSVIDERGDYQHTTRSTTNRYCSASSKTISALQTVKERNGV